ncbi:unnamed protein product [Oncorhynchus mykiss]|uniref:HotDog ACOT-type domain-containing protein n=1 Tax=Oncorhynchus mykiss TaxID=8022 RepID=A0A060WTF4_ONCMY|nr:unnamed protein product [Oncorhynchus mykiss]
MFVRSDPQQKQHATRLSLHIAILTAPGDLRQDKLNKEPVIIIIMSGTQSQATASSLQICRIMRPDDANIVGNVHGGTILKMIEEAGCIIGTRHCNTQPGVRVCLCGTG